MLVRLVRDTVSMRLPGVGTCLDQVACWTEGRLQCGFASMETPGSLMYASAAYVAAASALSVVTGVATTVVLYCPLVWPGLAPVVTVAVGPGVVAAV